MIEIIKSISVNLQALTVTTHSSSNYALRKIYKGTIKQFQSVDEVKNHIKTLVKNYVLNDVFFLPSCKSPLFYFIQQAEFLQNQKLGIRLKDLDKDRDELIIQTRSNDLAEEVWQSVLFQKRIKRETVYVQKKVLCGQGDYLSGLTCVNSLYFANSTQEKTAIPILHYFIVMNRFPRMNYILSYIDDNNK